jgi:hypothetical protein
MFFIGFGPTCRAPRSAASKRRCASSSLYFSGLDLFMSAILSEFDSFPREREFIGEMLMAYGEIEFILVACISVSLDIDHNTAARILFRVRGESARLGVCDAILRPTFANHKLKDKWITAYSAANHCKKIRNQYAHCHWQLHENKLHFVDLDQDAGESKGEVLNVTFYPVDLALIERQYAYFAYALAWLYCLYDRLLRKVGKKPDNLHFPEPKSIPQPPLDNRPKKAVRGRQGANA